MSKLSSKLIEKILRCEHHLIKSLADHTFIATNWNVLNLLYKDKSVYEIRYIGNIQSKISNDIYAAFQIIPTDGDSFNITKDVVHVAVKISSDRVAIRS